MASASYWESPIVTREPLVVNCNFVGIAAKRPPDAPNACFFHDLRRYVACSPVQPDEHQVPDSSSSVSQWGPKILNQGLMAAPNEQRRPDAIPH